jgi:pimeloyl-ACP methyl ester carboxylesterase
MKLAFVHGAGCTDEAFREQTVAFEGSLAVLLPGRRARPAGPTSIAGLADAVASELEANDFEGVLVGHSMGGAIVLELGLRGLPAVRGVVTISSGARLRVAPALLAGLERNFEAAAASLATSFFADPSPALVESAVAMLHEVGQRQTLADFRACDAFNASDRLSELPVPLLAIGAANDLLTPPKFAAFLADRVPVGSTRILDGAGHFVMLERPVETNALLRAFMARLDTR